MENKEIYWTYNNEKNKINDNILSRCDILFQNKEGKNIIFPSNIPYRALEYCEDTKDIIITVFLAFMMYFFISFFLINIWIAIIIFIFLLIGIFIVNCIAKFIRKKYIFKQHIIWKVNGESLNEEEKNIIEKIVNEKDRICNNCYCRIIFDNFCFLNAKEYNYNLDTLFNLWENPLFEYFCCNCYKEEKRKQFLSKYHGYKKVLFIMKCISLKKER